MALQEAANVVYLGEDEVSELEDTDGALAASSARAGPSVASITGAEASACVRQYTVRVEPLSKICAEALRAFVEGEAYGTLTLGETFTKLNDALKEEHSVIAHLNGSEFREFGSVLSSWVMRATGRAFSLKADEGKVLRYACIFRKLPEPRLVKRLPVALADVPSEACKACFLVRQGDASATDLNGVSPLAFARGQDTREHYKAGTNWEARSCPKIPWASLRTNANFVNTMFTPSLKDDLLRTMMRLKNADPSLEPKNLRRQANQAAGTLGLPAVPDMVMQGIMREIAKMGSEGDQRTPFAANRIDNFIGLLRERGWPYKTFEENGFVQAIYWIDLRHLAFLEGRELMQISHVLQHDTTFGVASPAAGFEKLSILIAKLPDKNVMLLTGLVVSDNSEYFRVGLNLLIEQFPRLAELRHLFVITDEDYAFMKAALEMLPMHRPRVCQWHKMRNFKKPRTRRNSTTAGEENKEHGDNRRRRLVQDDDDERDADGASQQELAEEEELI